MKKILTILLSFAIIASSVCFSGATAAAQSYRFDDGIVASFDSESGTLYLDGENGVSLANTYDYLRDWAYVSNLHNLADVKTVVLSFAVTYVGAGVFKDFISAEKLVVKNSTCTFGDRNSVPPNAKIYCFDNSPASSFAKENGIETGALYRVTFLGNISGRTPVLDAFPEGTPGSEIVKGREVYIPADVEAKHKRCYYPASFVDRMGFTGDMSMSELAIQQDCSFVKNTEQEKCEICGRLNPAFVSDPLTEPDTAPSEDTPITPPSEPPTGQTEPDPTTTTTNKNTTDKAEQLPSVRPVNPASQPGTAPASASAKPADEQTTAAPTTKPTTQAKPAGATKVGGEWIASKQKNTKIKKLTKGKKSFKVTWSKVTGITGYQVQYATDKKFKKNKKTVTISKNKTTSKTVNKLKAKKKYYVRIRTYKNVKLSGKTVKVYSKWSSAKTVTVK